MNPTLRVGVIGCGDISDIYLQAPEKFRAFEITACSSRGMDSARRQAERYGIPQVLSTEQLLASDDIDAVLNLTPPGLHTELTEAALDHGKHVYSEKPLSLDSRSAARLIEKAERGGLRLACAPDTFFGAGLQTCRDLVDRGVIGRPVGAVAFMMNRGHEHWHPNPAFFYEKGGGPVFDMGPYYLTALVSILGPVRRVGSLARAAFTERIVGSGPKAGRRIPVEVPTHVQGLVDFREGFACSIGMSFDVVSHRLPHIELYGTEGSLSFPDPNTFGGPVSLRRRGSDAWEEVAPVHSFSENSRGAGVADLAVAVSERREPRASAAMARHVIEIMEALERPPQDTGWAEISSECARPDPVGPEELKRLRGQDV